MTELAVGEQYEPLDGPQDFQEAFRREAQAVTDFINDFGDGYQKDASDPLDVKDGGSGNCFVADVLFVEESRR